MVVSWLLASAFLPTEVPIFAAIAAILVVQPSVNQSIGRAVERSIGVIVGVLVAYGIGVAFGETSWIVLLAVVLAIFLGWALKLTPVTATQVPITAMLVLSIGATTPNYAAIRIVETIFGAVIGIVVNLAIVPPVLLDPAHQSLVRLANEIAAGLDRLAAALSTPQTPAGLEELLITARLLRPMYDKAIKDLDQGRESLTLNPRQARLRQDLDKDAALATHLLPLVNRTLGMTRSLHDLYDERLATEPTVADIATQLTRSAHDLRLLVNDTTNADGGPAPLAVELPALTAPLVVTIPNSEHWILLGSLLEDLRRVREEILGS
ncbi:MAG: hypothetical protein QOF36_1895 [Microbacteriaceae bacterium]|nr:hypothetical protein [Microbacteriaceae bacterium]